MRRAFVDVFRSSGAILLLGMLGTGCGEIVNQDRDVIATLNGKNITRGELELHIYDMEDDKRPIIRSRRDYERVLFQYIDRKIKLPLGQQMASEGKIEIDRELARERFFQSAGDKEEQYRSMWAIPTPKPGEETDLMKVYNLRAEDFKAMKEIVEQGTDQFVDEMQGETAVQLLAREAYQAGELTLDPEALKLEYELNKDKLQTFEGMTFLGLQFPTSHPEASAEATRVRERLDAGENFDAVLEEYLAKNPKFGVESDIENNPDVARFQTFWDQASGVQAGEIVGPIFMPEYSRMRQGADGQVTQEVVPSSYLVFRVIDYRPARTLTLEEATPMLAAPLAYSEMMEKLREQNGFEIFEEKLPVVRGGDEDIFDS